MRRSKKIHPVPQTSFPIDTCLPPTWVQLLPPFWVPGANPRDGEYVPHLGLSFRVKSASSRSAEWFPCKKVKLRSAFRNARVFWLFFVFGPATVVEFRPSALEKRFNCETNTKFEGYRLQANQIPLKWSFVWGLYGLSWKVMQQTLPEMVVYKWMFFPKWSFFRPGIDSAGCW